MQQPGTQNAFLIQNCCLPALCNVLNLEHVVSNNTNECGQGASRAKIIHKERLGRHDPVSIISS